jgi:hypothetical protein
LSSIMEKETIWHIMSWDVNKCLKLSVSRGFH